MLRDTPVHIVVSVTLKVAQNCREKALHTGSGLVILLTELLSDKQRTMHQWVRSFYHVFAVSCEDDARRKGGTEGTREVKFEDPDLQKSADGLSIQIQIHRLSLRKRHLRRRQKHTIHGPTMRR